MGAWDQAPYSANSHFRASSQTIIPPLNFSASLQGSMLSLHESITTLGIAMDSLGRRMDIAMASETFRLNEEVMSLRANMHAIRMQV